MSETKTTLEGTKETIPTVKKNQVSKQKEILLSVKTLKNITDGLKKFTKTIQLAKEKSLNESDTSNIIFDMMGEIFGYDKFFDLTSEHKIKGQYCDYAVKIKDKIIFLMEVKAVGVDLNENHIFQASSYAGNEGIKRLVLTNLRRRQLYYLSFGQKIEKDLILDIDILSEKKLPEVIKKLQYLHKESFEKKLVDKALSQKLALSEKNIKKILLWEKFVKLLQSEIKKNTNLKLSYEETTKILEWYLKNN